MCKRRAPYRPDRIPPPLRMLSTLPVGKDAYRRIQQQAAEAAAAAIKDGKLQIELEFPVMMGKIDGFKNSST